MSVVSLILSGRALGYPKVIPYTPSLKTLGSFVFELSFEFLSNHNTDLYLVGLQLASVNYGAA